MQTEQRTNPGYRAPEITTIEVAAENGFALSALPPGKTPEGWD